MSVLRVSDVSRERYHSLSISSVWSLPTVRSARVLVVGAGALGNEVCKNLAMMGVRLIAVLDRDTVETANLTRSVFFREKDHGRPKTEVIEEQLRDLNPDVTVLTLNGDLDEILGVGFVRRMDVVFSCLDSRIARRSLNRLCQKAGKPLIDGAMEDLSGEVAVFVPGEGPCYECGLTKADLELIREARSCRGIALQRLKSGKVPTTSTIGSIVSAIQVQEGMKLIHGRRKQSLAGKRLVINGIINDFYAVPVLPVENCQGHTRLGEICCSDQLTACTSTARDLLNLYRSETGEDGFLELGREIVTKLQCGACGNSEALLQPLTQIRETAALCPVCREMRVPETTHTVDQSSPVVDWTLRQLTIPALDVVEVRGAAGTRWYELAGDLESFPVLAQASMAATPA